MKICIVANNAYRALISEDSAHLSGVERQTAIFSHWLTNKGHEISLITWDKGEDTVEVVNGFRIIKLCKARDGLPILRFFSPKWTSLNKALSDANADIYFHNSIDNYTRQISLWCKRKKKVFIYSFANDSDYNKNSLNTALFYTKNLFKYGLKNADLIVTQTNTQKLLIKENLKLDSIVIPMLGTPIIDYDLNAIESEEFTQKKIIWIGRVSEEKRLDWFIQVAEKLPDFEFEVIGSVDRTNSAYNKFINQIEMMPNISFLNRVNLSDLHWFYKHAAILCCTSTEEGFPNTFLEAWSYQTPVVTTFDPDNIIQEERLGMAVSNIPELVNAIFIMMNDVELRTQYAKNAWHYYTKKHSIEMVMHQYECAFKAQLSSPKTSSHFDQQSTQWNKFYDEKDAKSISHLDLQHRLLISKSMINSINLTNDVNTLDIGCGTGEVARILTNRTQYAVDFSKKMSSIAMERYPRLKVSTADATNLPFDALFFDTAISLGVLEYIKNYTQALDEINRVLKDGSYVIISFPNKSSLFRKMSRIERCIIKPIKIVIRKINKAPEPENLFHQQWSINSFSEALKNSGFSVLEVKYCTYGLLSPKLASSSFNIKICKWLNNTNKSNTWFVRNFAHTTVVLAKKDKQAGI